MLAWGAMLITSMKGGEPEDNERGCFKEKKARID